MYRLKYTDINKKATWEKLPVCPSCGDKLSYSQFTRKIKEALNHLAFESYIEAGETPRYTTTCHGYTIYTELVMHDLETRLKAEDYFQISFTVRDKFTGKFWLAKWTTGGYRIIGPMSDDFEGEHFEF